MNENILKKIDSLENSYVKDILKNIYQKQLKYNEVLKKYNSSKNIFEHTLKHYSKNVKLQCENKMTREQSIKFIRWIELENLNSDKIKYIENEKELVAISQLIKNDFILLKKYISYHKIDNKKINVFVATYEYIKKENENLKYMTAI
jgi:hypothetical protein